MSYKRYAILVIFFGCIVFGLTASTLFFWSRAAGEGSPKFVVDRQKTNDHSLYLSGTQDNVIDYKFEIFNQIQPSIVAIGSSRSMQVRSSFFKIPFVNFGGAANSIPELDYVLSKIISVEKKPNVVLIFSDIWWFNEKFQNPRLLFTPTNQPSYLTIPTLRPLIKPIAKNGVVISNDSRLGFGAIYQNQGFDAYGAFHYVSTITGETPSGDIKFQDTFRRIDTGTARFEHSDKFSVDGVARFNKLISRLESLNIHVLVVFPPVANVVYKRMAQSNKYSYIGELTSEISKTHSLFNFTNPSDIPQTSDCEFIDGFHGGETVYARMILKMADSDKYLADVINYNYLSQLTKNHAGQSSPETVALYGNGKSESDFLNLGCKK